MTDRLYQRTDDPELAGLKYRKRADINMSRSEGDNIGAVVEVSKEDSFSGGELRIRIDFEVNRMEGDETVAEDAQIVELENGQNEVSFEKSWDIESEGAYFIRSEITDMKADKKIGSSGVLCGVNKDVTSSNQREAGATPNTAATTTESRENPIEDNELIDMNDIEVREVTLSYPDEPENPRMTELEGGEHVYRLIVPLTWERLQDTLTLREEDRLEEQRRLIRKQVMQLTFLRVYRRTEGNTSLLDSMFEEIVMEGEI
jgi:hypothetical protein